MFFVAYILERAWESLGTISLHTRVHGKYEGMHVIDFFSVVNKMCCTRPIKILFRCQLFNLSPLFTKGQSFSLDLCCEQIIQNDSPLSALGCRAKQDPCTEESQALIPTWLLAGESQPMTWRGGTSSCNQKPLREGRKWFFSDDFGRVCSPVLSGHWLPNSEIVVVGGCIAAYMC